MNRINLTGNRFGYLTVITETEPTKSPSGRINRRWLCLCDCGKESVKNQHNLRSGGVVSCGCHQKKAMSRVTRKHGLSRHPIGYAWQGIVKRCKDRQSTGEDCQNKFVDIYHFHDYAMANGWFDGCVVCRKGDVGHYAPDNIYFGTQQQNNEEARAKHWELFNPNGEFVNIYNLNKYCRENDLDMGHLSKVAHGKVKSYKGWTAVQFDTE